MEIYILFLLAAAVYFANDICTIAELKQKINNSKSEIIKEINNINKTLQNGTEIQE